MYAIIETGGKQYKVAEGDVIKVEKLNVPEGEEVTIDSVPMVVLDNGRVVFEGAKARATVVGHGKGRKVIVFKYKPKVNYRRKTGHRQAYSKLKINKIEVERVDDQER